LKEKQFSKKTVMRILCVIDDLGSGGAQRQLVELASGFISLNHVVSFLTYHPASFYSSYLKELGISINYIKSSNYFTRIIKMRDFIRKGKFDAVISFLEGSNFICEIASIPYRRWKLIVGERSAKPEIKKSVKLILYRWFHLLADYTVANSHANIEIVRSVNPLLSLSRCRVIYNIVDFLVWKPSNVYIPRRNGKLRLIVAASHQKLKNLLGLIEAVCLLDPVEKKLLQVDWYGDRINEPFFDESFENAQIKIRDYKLESVFSFFPATKDLNKRILDFDVLGLFSFYEGFPNVICEGMACAKPIICSEVSDLPSILSYDKNLLFKPGNIDSIHKTLKYILSLSDQQLLSIGQINNKIAKEYFCKDIIVNEYLNLLA
jgi:glycosyltransferase involved in cell wall biosynthesis